MAKKRSKRAAAPADSGKALAEAAGREAGGKEAAVPAAATVEGRDADGDKTEDGGHEGSSGGAQVVESKRVQKRVAKQTRLMDNLRRTQTLIAASRGESKTKKSAKKRKKGGATSLTLDTLASALGDALPITLSKEAHKRQQLLTSKQRGKIVIDESKQMAAVLSHPAFKADPFAAIQQHLSNTLPSSSVATPPLPAKFATKQAREAAEKKKKKKKKGKKKSGGASSGDDMEM